MLAELIANAAFAVGVLLCLTVLVVAYNMSVIPGPLSILKARAPKRLGKYTGTGVVAQPTPRNKFILSKVPSITDTFYIPKFFGKNYIFGNTHFQTLASVLTHAEGSHKYTRQRLVVEKEGGAVALDWEVRGRVPGIDSGKTEDGFALAFWESVVRCGGRVRTYFMFPGVTGHSGDFYCERLVAMGAKEGFSTVVHNWRGLALNDQLFSDRIHPYPFATSDVIVSLDEVHSRLTLCPSCRGSATQTLEAARRGEQVPIPREINPLEKKGGCCICGTMRAPEDPVVGRNGVAGNEHVEDGPGVWGAPFIVALGMSLGGNTLAKYLGETCEEVAVEGAMAFGSPYDLRTTIASIERYPSKIYNRFICGNLHEVVKSNWQRLRKLSVEQNKEHRYAHSITTITDLAQNLHLREFDINMSAPMNGFNDVESYWAATSSHHVMSKIRIPFLAINARDDPVAPIFGTPMQRSRANPLLQFVHTAEGGHLGWLTEWDHGMSKKGASRTRMMKMVDEWGLALMEWNSGGHGESHLASGF